MSDLPEKCMERGIYAPFPCTSLAGYNTIQYNTIQYNTIVSSENSEFSSGAWRLP
jgi:hypothetical protein